MIRRSRRFAALDRQSSRFSSHLQNLRFQSTRFSRLRLIIFLSGFGLGVGLYYIVAQWLGWAVMALTLVVFNIVAHFHRKLIRSIKRHEIFLDIKHAQVARMRLDWSNIPLPPQPGQETEHPFEIDLDITGPRSLHHLLDTASSKDGSQLLSDWLLTPAPDAATILYRRKLVEELTPLARFRDKLQLAARLVSRQQLDGQHLLRFLERTKLPPAFTKILLSSTALAVVNISLFVLNQMNLLPAWWVFTVALYGVIYFLNQKYLNPLLDEAVLISEELRKFKAVLTFLENYRFDARPNLKELCESFWQPGKRPSEEMKRVTWVGAAIGLRMNPVFRLALNAVLPWDFFLARTLERLKQRLKNNLSDWLQAFVELEALSSLANFTYLNPNATFPDVSVGPGGRSSPVLVADSLGHPLIPDEQRKCNDFAFQSVGDITLITGSNMSGKSTFLKTLGVNLCLAFAGGPVLAKRLHTHLFRLFTCIQINDSLTDGFSFFYREVKRLKALLTELQNTHELPLLFLIDEIFKGTNNRERLIGSQSYIQALAGSNGVGIISTHDLELTSLADSISQIHNYHFREEVKNGKMVFDYKMRPGPCPSTNALKIMKLEGLPVREE